MFDLNDCTGLQSRKSIAERIGSSVSRLVEAALLESENVMKPETSKEAKERLTTLDEAVILYGPILDRIGIAIDVGKLKSLTVRAATDILIDLTISSVDMKYDNNLEKLGGTFSGLDDISLLLSSYLEAADEESSWPPYDDNLLNGISWDDLIASTRRVAADFESLTAHEKDSSCDPETESCNED